MHKCKKCRQFVSRNRAAIASPHSLGLSAGPDCMTGPATTTAAAFEGHSAGWLLTPMDGTFDTKQLLTVEGAEDSVSLLEAAAQIRKRSTVPRRTSNGHFTSNSGRWR